MTTRLLALALALAAGGCRPPGPSTAGNASGTRPGSALTAAGDAVPGSASAAATPTARALAVLGVASARPPAARPSVVPRLIVRDIDAAAGFYARAFGAVPHYGLRDREGIFAYAELGVGDAVVALEREAPARGIAAPETLGGTTGSLMLYLPDVDAAFAAALAEGAAPIREPADMEWGDRYAEVADPFGHRWALATRLAAGPGDGAAAADGAGYRYRPAGYRTASLFLIAPDADALIEFYVAALGASELERVEAPGGGVAHAALQIGDSVVMLADPPEVSGYGLVAPEVLGGTPLAATVYTRDADADFAAAIGAGATALSPVADRFWGDRAGEIEDPGGYAWEVATRIERVSPAEIQRRMLLEAD